MAKIDNASPCHRFQRGRLSLEAPVNFPSLVDQLEGPLTKFVFGYIHDRHTTEDLVQESFLRAFRNLARYRGQASMKSWIFTIARNLCLDYLKASDRSRLRLFENLDSRDRDQTLRREDLPESLRLDPSGHLELNESCNLVGQALSGLSTEEKNLLILRVYHGLSYREIARQCNVAPAGVGVRLCRALRALSGGLH